MSQNQVREKSIPTSIYYFDKSMEHSFGVIKKELPKQTQIITLVILQFPRFGN